MSNLVSNDMAKSARDYHLNAVPEAEALLKANHAISFTGGGQSYSYEEVASTSSSSTRGTKWRNNLGIGALSQAHFSVLNFGGGLEGAAGHQEVDESENLTSTEEDTSGTRGFELGDPDLGDKFVVDIHRDPLYNGFVFTTLRGSSGCPHEKNTYAREQVR